MRRRREASESGICARGRATSARSLTPLCPAHRACASTTSHTATARVKLARCTAPRRRHLSHSTSSLRTLEPCALLKQPVEQERVRSAQITATSAPRDSASSCATTSPRRSRSRARPRERERARAEAGGPSEGDDDDGNFIRCCCCCRPDPYRHSARPALGVVGLDLVLLGLVGVALVGVGDGRRLVARRRRPLGVGDRLLLRAALLDRLRLRVLDLLLLVGRLGARDGVDQGRVGRRRAVAALLVGGRNLLLDGGNALLGDTVLRAARAEREGGQRSESARARRAGTRQKRAASAPGCP